jgi:hypothetical protein
VNGSPEYVLTWKHWDMPSGPPICALRARARRTSDSAFGGWPTPDSSGFECRDVERMENRRQECKDRTRNGNGFGMTLGQLCQSQLAGWATPNSLEGRGGLQANPEKAMERRLQGHQLNLDDQVTLVGWATPTENDSRNGRNETANRSDPESNHHPGSTLCDQVTGLTGWATPSQTDYKIASNEDQRLGQLGSQAHGLTSLSSPAGMENHGVLNPAFGRWLMGFPASWDQASPGFVAWQELQAAIVAGDSGVTETRSYRRSQRRLSRHSLKPNPT